jgi:hypothetical protein
MSRLLSPVLLLAAVSALCAGCPAASLEGKGCPCSAGYFCCPSATPNACMLESERAKCRCRTTQLASLHVTTNGAPLPGEPPPDAATDGQVIFGDPPERWASYTFQGMGEKPLTADVIPDRSGFHITVAFTASVPDAQAYEGFGLSYDSTSCIDGSTLTGVEFEFAGDLGGKMLIVAVTSVNQVTAVDDTRRGACQGQSTTCYGASSPRTLVDPGPTMVRVPFTDLTGGMAGTVNTTATGGTGGLDALAGATLDVTQIVNVQWMLHASANLGADFTIRNVSFY